MAAADLVGDAPRLPWPDRVRLLTPTLSAIRASRHTFEPPQQGKTILRCSLCCSSAPGVGLIPWLASHPCPGELEKRPSIRGRAIHPSHRARWHGEVQYWLCGACGGTASTAMKGLAFQCPARPSIAGSRALSKINRGPKPWEASSCSSTTGAWRSRAGGAGGLLRGAPYRLPAPPSPDCAPGRCNPVGRRPSPARPAGMRDARTDSS